MLTTAHKHHPRSRSHDVQHTSLSEKLIRKLILYLDHHHQVILSSFLFPFMQWGSHTKEVEVLLTIVLHLVNDDCSVF